jgi:hypothetical protein
VNLATNDDARARRLRARLDQELSSLQATSTARDRLARGMRDARPAPAGGRGGTVARRRRQWLAVPLAAAAVTCVVAAVALLGGGVLRDGRRTSPAGTGGPSAGPTRTVRPFPMYPSSHEVSGYWLIVDAPRRGVTVGRPVHVRLVARKEPFRSATIQWGVTSATTKVDGHCPGDPGKAPSGEARHVYPVETTVVMRAFFVPCTTSKRVQVRVTVQVLPER